MEWFCYSTPSKIIGTDRVQTDISHLAEIAGVDRIQYMLSMYRYIREGRFLEILNMEAQEEIVDWLMKHRHYDFGTEFCLLLTTSINKAKNSAVWMRCFVDLSGNEPMIKAKGIWTGYATEIPEGLANLHTFVLGLKDLEIKIGGRGRWPTPRKRPKYIPLFASR